MCVRLSLCEGVGVGMCMGVGVWACVRVCVGVHIVGMYGLFLALCEQCVYRYEYACMCQREGSIERS